MEPAHVPLAGGRSARTVCDRSGPLVMAALAHCLSESSFLRTGKRLACLATLLLTIAGCRLDRGGLFAVAAGTGGAGLGGAAGQDGMPEPVTGGHGPSLGSGGVPHESTGGSNSGGSDEGGGTSATGGIDLRGFAGVGGDPTPAGSGGAAATGGRGSDTPDAAMQEDGPGESPPELPAEAGVVADARGRTDADPCASCREAGGVCEDAKTCLFDCHDDGACADRIVCPTSFTCHVMCGRRACAGGIDGTLAAGCVVSCDGEGSCGGVSCGGARSDVTCGAPGACGAVSLMATENHARCLGEASCSGDLFCKGNVCDLGCGGDGACAGRVSANASAATIDCTGADACQGRVSCSASTCAVRCMSGGSCGEGVCCNAGTCTLSGHTGKCM